jgi:hypothetical protein
MSARISRGARHSAAERFEANSGSRIFRIVDHPEIMRPMAARAAAR